MATLTAVSVEELTDRHRDACEAYVLNHPQATFFHRPGWRQVIADAYGYRCFYRIALRSGAIVGVLPLVHVKTLFFGNALISNGFCVYGGIVADDAAATAALARNAEDLGTELGVDHIELRHLDPPDGLPSDWAVRDSLHATFRKEMQDSEEANLKAIPRKKRADVRKGLKNPDLRVETDIPVDRFFRIYAISVRNHGTPVFPKGFFSAVKRHFPDDVELSCVSGPDGPVAALMTYFFRDQVMPYYGGALPLARRLHAFDLMYFRLMGRALDRGARIFDFGRSKQGSGGYDFKTYWGFEAQPLPYAFRLIGADRLPEINPNNPKYKLMIDVWRRLPMPLANTLGPMIARQLG